MMKSETKPKKKQKKQTRGRLSVEETANRTSLQAPASVGGAEKKAVSASAVGVSRWRRFVWMLPVLLGFLLYSGIYGNQLVHWDDVSMIEWAQNDPLSLSYVWEVMTKIGRTYQPLRDISYSIDVRLFGTDLWGYFLHNVLLYCLNIWLVYAIVRRLFQRFGSTQNALRQGPLENSSRDPLSPEGGVFAPRLVAALTACLFAAHPLHVESVAWLAARKEVLCGLFFFLSFWFFLRIDAWTGSKRYLGLGASFVSYLLASLSKPTAASLPLVILATDLILVRPSLEQWKKRIWIHIPFWVPAVGAALYFSFIAGTTKTILADLPLLQRLIDVNVVLSHYLKTLVAPVGLSARYAFDWSIPVTDPSVLIGAVFQLILAACFVLFLRRNRLVAFWIAWFYINFLPTSGIIPISIQAADRYIFISSLAFCCVVTMAALKVSDKAFARSKAVGRNVGPAFLVCVIAIFSVLSVRQSGIWRDDMTLWTHTAAVSPSDLSYYSLGEAYRRRNDLEQAKHYYQTSLNANPRFLQALNGLGNIMLLEKDIRKAESLYLKALEVDPEYRHAHRHLAIVYITLRDFDRALVHAEQAFRAYEHDSVLLDMLCLLYLRKGDSYKLREMATRLNAYESDRVNALIYLFRAYQGIGDTQGAMKFRSEAYELDPEKARKTERITAAAMKGYR
ncbi:MAG: tetratricopeptide repeat protein [Deltaproteobacteria bacterium]|nr:tetratricopeptide repeat protein [Deltaproteobacteria bacterium]